jgi:HAMP domain-containing protein
MRDIKSNNRASNLSLSELELIRTQPIVMTHHPREQRVTPLHLQQHLPEKDIRMVSSTTNAPTGRFVPRLNLLIRTLFIGVIPIILLTITHLWYSSQSNDFYLSQLMQDGAKQVAISIGSSVQRDNFTELRGQLAVLTRQPNIGFIYVQTIVAEEWQTKPEIKSHFDLTVIKAIHDETNQHPDQQLRWKDDQEGYRQLLTYRLNHLGTELSRGVKAILQEQVEAAQGREINTYQVSQIGVYENETGRTFGIADKNKAQFLITIGMIANRNVATIYQQNWNLLRFGIGFALLSIIVSILFTRSISVPILHLIRAANQMSNGRLEEKITYKSSDEIGQLAGALERLRISLDILRQRSHPARNDPSRNDPARNDSNQIDPTRNDKR